MQLVANTGGTLQVSCWRCGDYQLTAEARQVLAESSAPPPTGSLLSHALRWAAIRVNVPLIDYEAARKLIQRRRGIGTARPSDRLLLTWLNRSKEQSDSMRLEGWAAVLNEATTGEACRRINRVCGRGLVAVNRQENGVWDLSLTVSAGTLLDRQNDRRRRLFRTQRDQLEEESRRLVDTGYLYADKLVLKQFKCFKGRQEISFATEDGKVAQWTFLVGENGVGKTTVLQALASLYPVVPKRGSRLSLLAESYGIDFFSKPTLSEDFTVEAEYHQGPLNAESFDPAIFGAQSRGASIDRLEFLLQLAADDITLTFRDNITYKANYRHIPRSPLVVGYGASRAVAKYGLAADKGRSLAANSLFNPEVALQDPEDWLLQSDYISRFNQNESEGYSQAQKLQSALLDILPNVTAISVRAPDDVHDRPWVAFDTAQGVMDYRSLSVGYQSTIAWVVDLAIRMIENYPDAVYPLEKPALVLIDEVDIHLHPRWQRSITSHLGRIFPATQFIATTHSPLIIQGAVKANLVLLRPRGDEVEVVNDVDEIRDFRVDQILTSELFGLSSARPDRQAALFRRRTEILSSAEPSRYKAELDEIDAALANYDKASSVNLTDAALTLMNALGGRH